LKKLAAFKDWDWVRSEVSKRGREDFTTFQRVPIPGIGKKVLQKNRLWNQYNCNQEKPK